MAHAAHIEEDPKQRLLLRDATPKPLLRCAGLLASLGRPALARAFQAGRPALLRYLSQLMEVLSKLSKTSTSLRWRNKRLVAPRFANDPFIELPEAALHFLSSLRLCPRTFAFK